MDRQPFFPNNLLIEWFDAYKRPLPWRENPTPYRVWVSEIMLQQTRVAVVEGYFARWMESFPTIESLAKAPLEQVIKMWEGLGYYSRARNLHLGAQQCLKDFEGALPSEEEMLATIKGIGPYTLAAILNFAFRKRKALIDGNVLRVMSRYFAIETSIDLPATRKQIEELMTYFLPEQEFWKVSEGLMELGALICGREPKCGVCPLQASCLAKQKDIQNQLPIRKKKKEITLLKRIVALVMSEGQVALRKGKTGVIMADLYEFPYLEVECEKKGLILLKEGIGADWEHKKSLLVTKHHFTHYRASLYAHLFFTTKRDPEWIWVDKDKLLELPFSSGHRRILEYYIRPLA